MCVLCETAWYVCGGVYGLYECVRYMYESMCVVCVGYVHGVVWHVWYVWRLCVCMCGVCGLCLWFMVYVWGVVCVCGVVGTMCDVRCMCSFGVFTCMNVTWRFKVDVCAFLYWPPPFFFEAGSFTEQLSRLAS